MREDVLAPWRVLEVSGWEGVAEESRGVRPKLWLDDGTGALWLRKSPRERSPFEPSIERLALTLATACGVTAAHAELCEWDGARGIVVRSFLAPNESLHGGDQILRGVDERYDPDRHELHTLTRVHAALLAHDPAGGMWRDFLRLCAFDACIGNGDRHQGNWSLAIGPRGARLAPLYDPAACLGSELQTAHALVTKPTAASVERYVRGCPSGFGDGVRRIPQEDALQQLRRFPEWRALASEVTAAVRLVVEGPLDSHLEASPVGWYSPGHRRLAVLLLRARTRRMEQLL